MSTDEGNDAEIISCIDDGINCSGSSSDAQDISISFALHRGEESSIEEDSVIVEEQNEADDDQEKQDRNNDTEPPKATSIVPLLEIDEFGAAIPEATDASSEFYKYRDFSEVSEKDVANEPNARSNGGKAPRNSRAYAVRVQKFPTKLYAILAQKEFQDIVTWMPHGRSWKVLKPDLFESLVLPIFFDFSNYHSFNRLVNAWSFRRITEGADRGSYYHELFLRGKPYLQKCMRRLPKTRKKSPMRKEDEPDFYAMDKEKPLPQCHGTTTFQFGPNHLMHRYPTPFSVASGVVPMLIPVQMYMQMQTPVPTYYLQPQHHAMAGVNGLGFGSNGTHNEGEASLICGTDSTVSPNIHSIESPTVGPVGGVNCGNDSVGSAGMYTNVMGDGIETGMTMNGINAIGGEGMGIGNAVASLGTFDAEDSMIRDGAMGL